MIWQREIQLLISLKTFFRSQYQEVYFLLFQFKFNIKMANWAREFLKLMTLLILNFTFILLNRCILRANPHRHCGNNPNSGLINLFVINRKQRKYRCGLLPLWRWGLSLETCLSNKMNVKFKIKSVVYVIKIIPWNLWVRNHQ